MQFNIKLPIHIQDTVGPSKETWKLKWLPVRSLFKPKLPPPLSVSVSVCQFVSFHIYMYTVILNFMIPPTCGQPTVGRLTGDSWLTGGQLMGNSWLTCVSGIIKFRITHVYPERPRFLSKKCYINWYLFCFQCQVCSLHFLHTFCCVCDIWQLNIKC